MSVRAIAEGGKYVRPSVRLSLRHARDPCLNGSRYRNAFARHDHRAIVSSFLRPKFVVVSLGVYPKQVC